MGEIEISVVSPVYVAEKILVELVNQIETNVSQITDKYEIVLVEDSGPDCSWEVIKEIAAQNPKVRGFKFSRNFGQHAAIKAGITLAEGNCCIVMDCDLQDNPKYIMDLYLKYKEGFDIVYTYKRRRKHSVFKNIAANLFNKIFNYLVDNSSLESNNGVGSYSLLSRQAMTEFLNFNDYQFHYLLVLRWMGFNSAKIEIEHTERFQGKSSYTLGKLIQHATVAIVYQSDKLLRLNIYAGAVIAGVSLMFGVYIIIKSFIVPFQTGWASIAILISFALGTLLFSLGIIGLYVGKMFEQVKNRPHYIIAKKTP